MGILKIIIKNKTCESEKMEYFQEMK